MNKLIQKSHFIFIMIGIEIQYLKNWFPLETKDELTHAMMLFAKHKTLKL